MITTKDTITSIELLFAALASASLASAALASASCSLVIEDMGSVGAEFGGIRPAGDGALMSVCASRGGMADEEFEIAGLLDELADLGGFEPDPAARGGLEDGAAVRGGFEGVGPLPGQSTLPFEISAAPVTSNCAPVCALNTGASAAFSSPNAGRITTRKVPSTQPLSFDIAAMALSG